MRRTLLAVTILSLVLACAYLRTAQSQSAPRRVEIHVKRFGYQPNEVTLKKGEPIVLVLTSEDVPHGLRFRQLNLELKAPKAGSTQTQFTPTATGDFVGHCSVFCGSGHGGMTFTLHVVD